MVKQAKPKTIIDLGCGPFAPWGSLARSHMEGAVQEPRDPRYSPTDHPSRVPLIGVDLCDRLAPVKGQGKQDAPNPLTYGLDEFVKADALEFVKKLQSPADLIIAIDLIERMDRQRGAELLKELSRKAHFLILGIPRGRRFEAEDEYVGKNPHDRVRSAWWQDDQDIDGFTCLSHWHGAGSPSFYWLGLYGSSKIPLSG